MSTVTRVEVRSRDSDPREHRVAKQAQRFLEIPIQGVEEIQVFWLESQSEQPIPWDLAYAWGTEILSDPILQQVSLSPQDLEFAAKSLPRPAYVIEVRFRPGVTDNCGRSATEALQLVSGLARELGVQVYSGSIYVLYGQVSRAEAERVAEELLANSVIQEIRIDSYADFREGERFRNPTVPLVRLPSAEIFREVDIFTDDKNLERMSQENFWALSVQELRTIAAHFDRADVIATREAEGLPKRPTDVEIEILAQTWSEHCKHKIFAAEINYVEHESAPAHLAHLGPQNVKGLFKTFIRGVTEKIRQERKLDWLGSGFTDNAGIVRFDPKLDLCIKVETHNSPSALDPYGGALTGIVGVNRDVLGCGLGARPIANTDVFCFGPPNWPGPGEERELPQGLKHPRRILDGVHLGIEHGGNKSGIPTVNGAISFHRDFSGKPLVFCGTIGVLPPKLPDGRDSSGKGQKPGHRVVMAGGRIGKDGIHGATFSSMELDDKSPATAVQIGDPITQKRLADFLLEARDLGLFSSLTDNGAGGLSSSVGEMAGATGGATIDVSLAPTKYPGLSPFELTVSESQERMTFAVPRESLAAFSELARRRGVEIADLGEFRADGFFRVQYHGRTVALLDMDFLHNGLPPMQLEAEWRGSLEEREWAKPAAKVAVEARNLGSREFLETALLSVLAAWNVRSKEGLVRRFDHEVQAASVIKPFVGVNAEGPGNAAVIWLEPAGGSPGAGVAIGCGILPQYARYDTYLMAQYVLDEAIRNCVAVGADPDRVALIDNFCWPDPIESARNPDGSAKLAALVRACRGLYDGALIFGAPFVSGKDSMKNDFYGKSRFGKEVKISVPPTVLVTAMGFVPEVDKTVTSDFKRAGDRLFLVGSSGAELGSSELFNIFELPGTLKLASPPAIDLQRNYKLYRQLYSAIRSGLLTSCHDISEGGLATAIAESAIGGDLGADIELTAIATSGATVLEFLFNESAGRFLVSVEEKNTTAFLQIMRDHFVAPLGTVSSDPFLRFADEGLVLVDLPLARVKTAWKEGFNQ